MAKHQVKYYTKRQYNTLLHILEFPDNYSGMNNWDTNNLAYTMSVGDASKRQKTSQIDNSWFLERGFKPIAKINAGFFYGSSSGLATIGLAMSDWGNMYGNETVYSNRWQCYYKDGKLVADLLESQQQLDDIHRYSAYWGISLSYMLVKNGAINLDGSDKHSSILGVNPRTLIGQKKDGTHIWVVADGRGKNDSTGLTAQQSAQVMLDLGCDIAMNCDGGGSSTMVVDGIVKNSPTDGAERAVATAFILYGKDVEIVLGDNSSNGDTLENKTLVLDAGHGYHTSGKRTPDGIREWTLNNSVCNYVQDKLKDYNVTIHRTDDTTGETDVSLSQRVSKTNSISPDLFVSVHHNANTGSWGDWTGTEVYWHTYGSTADQKVAGILAPKIASKTGLKNRGVKQASFTVLGCNSHIPAVLCEGGFMDSNIDHPVITSSKGQEAYADALVEGIIEYLGLKKVVIPEPEMEDNPIHDSRLYFTNGQSNKPKIKVIGTEPLNIRSGRGTSFEVIGSLPVNSIVKANYILQESTGGPLWSSIDYLEVESRLGYIHLGFCRPVINPTVRLNGSSDITIEVNSVYNDEGVSITGDEDNLIDCIKTSTLPNTSVIGLHTVTYTVYDKTGDVFTTLTRNVRVVDTTPPVIKLKGSNPVNIYVGEDYVEAGATATDNSGEVINVDIVGGVDNTQPCTNIINYYAEDSSGNRSHEIRIVNVKKKSGKPFEKGHYNSLAIVNADFINVYSDRSSSSEIKAQLLQNEIIKVHYIAGPERYSSEQNLWGIIITDCKSGFINLDLCEPF